MITRKVYRKYGVAILFSVGCIFFINTTGFGGNVQSFKVYGVAIDGYDPVAYFTEGRPVKGSSAYSFAWNEAQWLFSKPEHRDMFATNPEKYTPKRDGF